MTKTKKTKEQRKADAAFIEKISSINIGVKSSGKCPDCGMPVMSAPDGAKPVGMLFGSMHGQPVGGPVYAAPMPVQPTRGSDEEQSLCA